MEALLAISGTIYKKFAVPVHEGCGDEKRRGRVIHL